jgi:hypothetical protein
LCWVIALLLALVRPSVVAAEVTLFVSPLGSDKWAVQYEADTLLWSGGFIVDGATAFEFAGIDAGGDPGPALNATYDVSALPRALAGSLIGEPMPSLIVNPHGGFSNDSMGPVATRVDLGVATVPAGTPTVRYAEIEGVAPRLWAGVGGYLPVTEITIEVDTGVGVPTLPGWSVVFLGVLLLGLVWRLLRARHARRPDLL